MRSRKRQKQNFAGNWFVWLVLTPMILTIGAQVESAEDVVEMGELSFKDFNVFVFDSIMQVPHVDGSLAAGGSITTSSFGYNYGHALQTAVVARDSFTANNGTVNGDLYTGEPIDLPQSVNVTGEVYHLQVIDFAENENYLRKISKHAAGMAVNADADVQYCNLYLYGQSEQLNVFSVDSETLNTTCYMSITVPSDSTVVINVTGTSPVIQYFYIERNSHSSSRILWNFFEAEQVSLDGIDFEGTILAPSAEVVLGWMHVNGAVIANSARGPGEVHNYRFIPWEEIEPPGLYSMEESMFPERERGDWLYSITEYNRYSFESCSGGEHEDALEVIRVPAKEIELSGIPASAIPISRNCQGAEDEQFYRVITSNLGKTATLVQDSWDSTVSCDDPANLKEDPDSGEVQISVCSLTTIADSNDATHLEDGFVGNIVIADDIIVDGVINVNYLNLILIAKNSITFRQGSKIIGPPILNYSPLRAASGSAALNETPREGVAWSYEAWDWYVCMVSYQGPFPPGPSCGPVPSTYSEFGTNKQYSDFTPPDDGMDGIESGSVMLVSPDVAGPVTLELTGGNGQHGGHGVDVTCHADDPLCRESIEGKGHYGGYGGDAGRGGNLVIISDSIAPVTFSANAGTPGEWGRPSVYIPLENEFPLADQSSGGSDPGLPPHIDDRLYDRYWESGSDLFEYTPQPDIEWAYEIDGEMVEIALLHPTHAGADGADGVDGQQMVMSLGDAYYDLAFWFAQRGAERLNLNGHYYARFTDDKYEEGQVNRANAIYQFEKLGDQYCGDMDDDGNITWSGGGLGVTNEAFEARQALCREALVRLKLLKSGANYFGTDDDLYVYVAPEAMRSLHEEIIDLFMKYNDEFWDSVVDQNYDFDSKIWLDELDGTAAEKTSAVQLEQANADFYAQKVVVALARMERNQEAIEENLTTFDVLGERLTAALLAPAPSFMDVFSNVLAMASAMGQLASGSIGGIANLASFMGDVFTEPALNFEAFADSLGPLNTFSDVPVEAKKVGAYADGLLNGFKVDGGSTTGINDIIDDISRAAKGAGGILSQDGSNEVGLNLEAVIDADLTINEDLQEAIISLYGAKGLLQDIPPDAITNKQQAIGLISRQIDLLREVEVFNRDAQDLTEAHLLAAAELDLALQRVELAELKAANAVFLQRKMMCRLGLIDKSSVECDGILVHHTIEEGEEIRDANCSLAKIFGDTTLLFDFLYERSKNFATLTTDEIPQISRRATDYRLSPLTNEWQQALDRRTVSEVFGELANQFGTEDLDRGVVGGLICDPVNVDQCDTALTGWSPEYAAAAMSSFRSRGKTTFSLDEACNETCHTFLISEEDIRQRVVGVTVKPLMADGYRLGCTLPPEQCPEPIDPTLPPDAPMRSDYDWLMTTRHGPIATFEFEQETYQTFNFSNQHAKNLCRLAGNYIENFNLACEDIVHFKTSSNFPYPSYLNEYFEASYPVNEITPFENNPRLFGTSIRGNWEVDINETVVMLNSAGDSCYGTTPEAFNPNCMPTECCFLIECPEDEPDCAPETKCCPQDGCTLDELADLPTFCQEDNNVAALFSVCAPYVSGTGSLERHGDTACCTPGGHFRSDLDEAAAEDCNNNGWSEHSCSTPEDCYRICGPQCAAFKNALNGFSFVIQWRK